MFCKRSYIGACAAILLLVGPMARAQTIPSNKPTSLTQVPAPTLTVATTPAAYSNGGQAVKVNYVRERDAMGRITDTLVYYGAGFADVKETTNYFDGLGRPLQTVTRQATPGSSPQDLVAPVVYDAFGREVYKYLPYVSSTGNTSDGLLRQDPFTDQKNFFQNTYPNEQPAYAGEQVYYGQTIYEASPLNRLLQSMVAGNSWAGSGVGGAKQYLVNAISDSVVIWNISSDTLTYVNNDNSTNIPLSGGYYIAGQLYKNVTTDEAGHAVVEYRDMEGQVILKKVQIGTIAADFSGYNGWLCTYYIYDDLNQLRFVMSPKAVTAIYGNNWNVGTDTTVISELCFRYEYDGRRRMLGKKVPGAGWNYMVYDMRDRPVYTQDANMRGKSQWMATLYDALNRTTTTGMIGFSGTRSDLQRYVSANTGNSIASSVTVNGTTPSAVVQNVTLSGSVNGDNQAASSITLDNGFQTPDVVDFTAEIVAGSSAGTPFGNTVSVIDNPLPDNSNFIPLTLTFYDEYSSQLDRSYSALFNGRLSAGNNLHGESLPGLTEQQAVQLIGQTTVSKVRVIEDPNDLTKGQWLSTVNFFDDRLRPVQVQSDNYKGGKDTVTNLYNFTGKVLASYLAHNNPQATTNANIHVATIMNYDHANRLLETYKTINDADSTKRLIARQEYDAMGQLKRKYVGQQPADGSFLETQDYSYNIRGWLKGINKDYANNDNSHGGNSRWFGMELDYDWGFDHNQLNGNIGGWKWRTGGDGVQRSYGFGYDAANRFLSADFNQNSGSTWDKMAKIDFSVIMGNGTDASTAYDENGNIRAMLQIGWQLGGSHPIDSLNYSYYSNSNKLQNIIDGRNDPQTTLGDFRTSSLSPYITSKTASAIDYVYDANGNLTRDLNKDIGSQSADGIVYNHLNLPWKITMRAATGNKGSIYYIYDATGNKLEKITRDTTGSLVTTTTYIGGFQFQGKRVLTDGNLPADTLKFFAHEEGRVRVNTDTASGQSFPSFKYDYFLKDHLGNTRMVLTDEKQTDMYPAATMEVADSVTEDLYYTKLAETRVALPAGYPTDTTTNPNNYVSRLSGGSSGPKIGPGITLKVMAGDAFNIRVSSWYKLNGVSPGTPANPVSDLVTSLIAGVSSLPGAGHPTAAILQSNSASLSDNFTQFLSDTAGGTSQTKPFAFLNWVLFDNQFNYVAESSGFQQVGQDQELKKHILTDLPVTKSGYLYIYLSNETPNVDVFFDNLQITHMRGAMLEEEHYYPFGLQIAGISSKAMKSSYSENLYKYNGKEMQSREFNDGTGLEEYDYGARFYDPQIGRWGVKDPKIEKYNSISGYQYCMNNPVLYIDPNGMENVIYLVGVEGMSRKELRAIQKQVNQNFKDLGLKTQAKIFAGKDFTKAYDNMDKTDAVAFIGNENAVTSAISKVDQKFADYLKNDPDFGDGGKINPEVSGNPWGVVTNDKIIAINTEDTKEEASRFDVTPAEAAAFNVVHGAGHNSWMDHGDEGGVAHGMNNAAIPKYSVMSSGGYINNGMLTIGSKAAPLSGYIKTTNNQGVVHDSYVNRFGNANPVANSKIPVENGQKN